MDEYYSPQEIRWNKAQIVWLIKNLPALREGIWPTDPHGTGYIEAPITKRGKKHYAPFERISDILCEIDRRLEPTGRDGVWLEAVYGWWLYEETLAKKFRVSPDTVRARIKKALEYICPPWPKDVSYEKFKLEREMANDKDRV